MKFEFDPAKSAANKAKHGVDFVEAQDIWLDRYAGFSEAVHRGEARFAVTGLIGEKLWTAIFVERSERYRIISVRRARRDEVEAYEQAKH
jgi:uncharacterized protein